MANSGIQVFEMTTGEGLKQSHEKSVAERFLNLYNLYLKKSFQFAKLGDPPEPDVIYTDAKDPACSLGVEVTTVYRPTPGAALNDINDVLQPDPQAKKGEEMTEAKWMWNQARGKTTPPIWTSGVTKEPTANQIQELQESIEAKLTKAYSGCIKCFLVVDWQDGWIDETVIGKVREHFSSKSLVQDPFDEIWILFLLSSEMGREGIIKVAPELDGPYLAPSS